MITSDEFLTILSDTVLRGEVQEVEKASYDIEDTGTVQVWREGERVFFDLALEDQQAFLQLFGRTSKQLDERNRLHAAGFTTVNENDTKVVLSDKFQDLFWDVTDALS